jgi:mRNA interferase MazF
LAQFVKGDVVVLPFPFSDLSQVKRRPALVVAQASREDVLMCQITSQAPRETGAIQISSSDFQKGGLIRASCARPERLFTADSRIIGYKAGTLNESVVGRVVDK